MQSISMLNGLLDGFLIWLESLFSIIPKYYYLLLTMIFNLMDILQMVMRKVAGLDSLYHIGSGAVLDTEGGQDIILKIMMEPVIQETFIAMLVIGVLLVFVFTIIAILRTEYNAEDAKSASKGRIIGKSMRAVGIMFLIPSLTYLGFTLSNSILRVLDSATMVPVTQLSASASEVLQPGYNYNIFGLDIGSTSTPLSGMAFRAAAFKANRIRTDTEFANDLALSGNDVHGPTFGGAFNPGEGSSMDQTGRTRAAQTVDDAFVNGYLITDQSLSLNDRLDNGNSNYIKKYANAVVLFVGLNNKELTSINKFNVNLVWFFYDLWKFDWVLGIGIILVISVLLLNITLGLMRRVYDILILFIISPTIAATIPLDDGGIFKKWRQKFVGKALSAYGPIVSLNLFFMIVPFISTISFYGTGSGSLYKPIVFADLIVQAFFVIVGLVAVKDVSKMLSDFIGAEDAGDVGKAMSGEVVGTALKIAAVASGAGAVASKAIAATAKGGKAGVMLGKAGVQRGMGGLANRSADKMQKKADAEYTEAKSKFVADGGDLSDKRRGTQAVRQEFRDSSKAYTEKMEQVQAKRQKAMGHLADAGGSLKKSGSDIKMAGMHAVGMVTNPLKTPLRVMGHALGGSAYATAIGYANKSRTGPLAIANNLTFGIANKLKDKKGHKEAVKGEYIKEVAKRELEKKEAAKKESEKK